MKSCIRYLVLSDIHLGHNINKTPYIINNLHNFFINYRKQLKFLDMIIIAGDTFDRLLMTSSIDFIMATEWLTELVTYCKDNNIILRILEGTPSHDWKQAKVITTIIEKFNIEIDYKYIDTLYIEQNNKLGLNILYVPDEYKHSAKDTYKDVLKLLKQNKLKEVDIAIMHGQFHYQLPQVKLESSHDEDNYLNIVKHYINVGHIHTHSSYERIIAQGSFDRLAHNEEEPKGAVLVELNNNTDNKYIFLTNENAMVFKTFKFEKEDIENIIKTLDKELNKLPINSNIRIIAKSEKFLSKDLETIIKRYSDYKIKFDKKDNKIITTSLIDDVININSFSITKENIKELLLTELKKYNLTNKELEIFDNELILATK